MNININYGSSYLLNIENSEGILNYVNIDPINNLIYTKEDLDVGIYDLSGIQIIVKQNILYDLTQISKSCKLIPILHPSINDGIFYIDGSNENININLTNGIINLNNLDIGIYSFDVMWELNSVIASYYINFVIKPEFYYEPNEFTILYCEIKQSDLPIISPLNYDYIINSKYKVSLSGIIEFINYDIGYHIIPITLIMNNISVTTTYNLYVLPEIKYLSDIYIGFANNKFCTDQPIVSQFGGLFLLSTNDYFNIDSKTGIITINALTNIYNLEISYIKNNVSNKCNITIIIKPIITYNNTESMNQSELESSNRRSINEFRSLYCSKIPSSNEPINGIFELIDTKVTKYNGTTNNNYEIQISNITIDISSGIINYINLYPNIYLIKVKYTHNINELCNTESICKLTVNPILNIISKNQTINYGEQFQNVYFDFYPQLFNFAKQLSCNNSDVIIVDNYNYLDLNNIKNIGIYDIRLYFTINNLTDYKDYNFTILPVIKYNLNNYCYYNEVFNSDIPIIEPKLPYTKIFSGTNVDPSNGIISFNNLYVGEYNFIIYLNYANFDISTNFNLIVKPILIIPSQNIFHSNSISGIIYLPKGGTLYQSSNYPHTNSSSIYKNEAPDTQFYNFVKQIKSLDSGSYNYNLSYKLNNIETAINSTFNILKKELILKYFIEDKDYDRTKLVNITTDVSNIIIKAEFTDFYVGINKKIVINNIILPEYLNINNYVNKINLKGNIYPKKITPNINIYDKEYDGKLTSNIHISHNLVNIKSYSALYTCKDIGLQTVIIKNIITDNLNYQFTKINYTISSYILPKKAYITFICQDKNFDDTSNCNIFLKNIDGINNKDIIYMVNINAVFSNYNVGYNEINIINYDLHGNNYNNYNLVFNKIYANILPKKILLESSANDKIYDSTIVAEVILKVPININFKILSYNANFIDKNVSIRKKILITNVILEDKNYYVDDYIFYGNILPKPLDFNYYGDNKIYDGTSNLTGTYIIKTISGDDISCIYNSKFIDINAGNNKKLLISNLKLYGKDAKNYIIKNIIVNSSSIYQKELFITFNSIDKMYDKTTRAFVEIKSISGLLLCDKNVDFKILSSNVNYEDYFIGKNKDIFINNIVFTPSIINYYCNNTKCIGNILHREIILDIKVPDKIYDGNTNVNINIININNIIHDDSIYIQSIDANFIDSNTCNNKIININNIKLYGPSSDNYVCNNFTFFGNIKPKYIDIDFKAEDQEYDDNLIPNLICKNIKSYTSFYKEINIGEQEIIITNITLSDSINYIINDQIIKGIILPKKVNINFIAKDKIYDGSNNVIISYDNNLILSYTAQFEDVNVGYKKVFINNIKINNLKYFTDDNVIIYGNILPYELFINPNISKLYDGNNNYDILSGCRSILVSDPHTSFSISSQTYKILSATCLFEQSNIGKNIKIEIKDIILNDTNYIINNFETIGNIEPVILKPKFIIEDKIYDGTTKVDIINIISDISIISYNAYYINKNVGLQQVIIDNIIFSNSNYIIDICESEQMSDNKSISNESQLFGSDNKTRCIYLESNIKPLKLDIVFNIKEKIYDKNNNANIDSYNILNIGWYGEQSIGGLEKRSDNDQMIESRSKENINILSYNAIYDNINVGKQKVIINNIIIDSNNYITEEYISYGVIKPSLLKINFKNLGKIYDKNNSTKLEIDWDLMDENIKINFKSSYSSFIVGNNINIQIFDIQLNNYNYYINNFKIIGYILPKEVDCLFKFINNIIVGNLIGIINNDDIWINNYISYIKDGETYIQNIILGGNDKTNYKILNSIYKVLSS